MKRYLTFLAALCLFFNANAQRKPSNQTTDIAAGGIRIGQAVPDVLISNASGLVINHQPVTSFRLSRLKGKLVILDFWATWCAPCRAMVPVLDSLQKQFGEKIFILPVTYQDKATAAPVLAQLQKIKPFHLPEITSDNALHRLFPHRSLPHFVWIGADGTVSAITEEKEVTAANISKMLGSNPTGIIRLAAKRDLSINYNKEQPLYIGANPGNTDKLLYHSVLSGYVPGLQAGMDMFPPDSAGAVRSVIRNVPLTWLFRMAYSDHDRWFSGPRMRLLTADSLKMKSRLSGQDYQAWLAGGSGWCYELLAPRQLARRSFEIMREDISRLFPQYQIAVENTRTRCLVLVRTSAADKLHTAGGQGSVDIGPYSCQLSNASLAQLIKRLQVQYMANLPLPVLDGTGYTAPVDLVLNAPLNDVQALNRELAAYDLRFVEKEAPVDLLVVRDNPDQRQTTKP